MILCNRKSSSTLSFLVAALSGCSRSKLVRVQATPQLLDSVKASGDGLDGLVADLSLLVTSALLVVTMFASRNKCHASSNRCHATSNKVL